VLATDADEAMAAGADRPPLEFQFDVIPMVEGIGDLGGAPGVRAGNRIHHLIGKHHTPAEGVVGPVALDHRDMVGRMPRLHQQREIQPGRPTSDADDAHAIPPAELF